MAHDAFVSVVDLEARTLTKAIPTTCDAEDIVLTDAGFAYVFPRTDQWVDIHSIDIAAGVDRTTGDKWSIYAGTSAKLHPSGQYMYGIDTVSAADPWALAIMDAQPGS